MFHVITILIFSFLPHFSFLEVASGHNPKICDEDLEAQKPKPFGGTRISSFHFDEELSNQLFAEMLKLSDGGKIEWNSENWSAESVRFNAPKAELKKDYSDATTYFAGVWHEMVTRFLAPESLKAIVNQLRDSLKDTELADHYPSVDLRWTDGKVGEIKTDKLHTDVVYIRILVTLVGPSTIVKAASGELVQEPTGTPVVVSGEYRKEKESPTLHASPLSNGEPRLLLILTY